MYKLLLKVAALFGSSASALPIWPALSLLFVCLLPLLLYQCSSARLEDLQVEYSSLAAEYERLQQDLEQAQGVLAQCRQAASLYDSVLAAHRQANIEIKRKYERQRQELMRSLLAQENSVLQEEKHETVKTRLDSEEDAAKSDRVFQDWCAQPVPALLRGLLLAPGDDVLP